MRSKLSNFEHVWGMEPGVGPGRGGGVLCGEGPVAS